MHIPNILVTDTHSSAPNLLLNHTSKVYYEFIFVSLVIYFHIDIIFAFCY